MLDNDGYQPFRSEEKVINYIEGVAADAAEGTDNLLRNMITSLEIAFNIDYRI